MTVTPYRNKGSLPQHNLRLILKSEVVTFWLKPQYLGSLSNVGVEGEREQDPGSEVIEVSEAKCDAFQNLDSVVAPLGKAVGQVKIECVEDVGFPVDQHLATGSELRDSQPVAGIQPVFQAF